MTNVVKNSGMENVKERIFNMLISIAKIQTGKDIDTIGFAASFENFSISFYGLSDENYKVIVEDFGHMKGKEWVQAKPTEEQIKEMQKMINQALPEIVEANKPEEFTEAIIDHYNYNGVSRAMFY